MRRVSLFALVLLSCRHRGEGTNIPEFGKCVEGNRTSICAAGLFCDTSNAYEEREGNDYVRYGTCTRPKEVGAVCSARVRGMCRAPAVCVEDSGPNNGTRAAYAGHCQQQSLSTTQ
jgi:hypothetical protein